MRTGFRPMGDSNLNDWEQLSEAQREDVDVLRDRMNKHLIAETAAFYKQHPELQLQWGFTCDALIRGEHDTLREIPNGGF
jgi:hypothetical protein